MQVQKSPAQPPENVECRPHRLRLILRRLESERELGRAYQPRFNPGQLALPWLGALFAITLLSLLSSWSSYLLTAAPLGASSVLLFGQPSSPMAQPRNIVLGNTTAAIVSVMVVLLVGRSHWAIGLAVGITIVLSQRLRCLHPPAGGVAFLGVYLGVSPRFILFPVFTGSLLLVVMALVFSRWVMPAERYPRHWL